MPIRICIIFSRAMPMNSARGINSSESDTEECGRLAPEALYDGDTFEPPRT